MLGHQTKGKSNVVNCTVGTCAFHGSNNQCNAGGIKVGTEYALDKTETFCSTYEHKTS
ncbi:MAG: DUF1540 domain-containing protein [Oscillospiraceae bacterium]|nr:DUF1540 domain-containing protein [Oscillospiraceae bacterium]